MWPGEKVDKASQSGVEMQRHMSIELVKAEIAKFLADADPMVLCIRGRWGVGKTYAWNEQLKLVV